LNWKNKAFGDKYIELMLFNFIVIAPIEALKTGCFELHKAVLNLNLACYTSFWVVYKILGCSKKLSFYSLFIKQVENQNFHLEFC